MRLFPRRAARSDVEIDLTPIVDVVFILIIFLLLLGTEQKKKQDDAHLHFPIELARSHGVAAQDHDLLLVAINEHGQIFCQNQQFQERKKFIQWLSQHKENASKRIELAADRRLPSGNLLELIAALRQLGFSRLVVRMGLEAPRRP